MSQAFGSPGLQELAVPYAWDLLLELLMDASLIIDAPAQISL